MDLTFSSANTELFREGEWTVQKWQEMFPKDFILNCLEHPVIAFDGKLPVGLFEVSHDYFENVCWLDALWVCPEKRHNGHGSKILAYLVDTCQYDRIKLFAANHSAPYYEKHGFKNTIGNYFEKEVDE